MRRGGKCRVDTVAVLDVGKSNVKLSLVDAEGRAVIASRSTPNTVVTGKPYPHFDVERLWGWFLAGLRDFNGERPIDLIATTTHGACFVLVVGDRLALPVLDYEYAGPDSLPPPTTPRAAISPRRCRRLCRED